MDSITTGVGDAPDVAATQAADSPPASQGSGAPSEQSLATSQPLVQGQEPEDVLAGIPPVEELTKLAEQKVPHAEALAKLRGAYEPLKTEYQEFKSKVEPFQPVLDRFETPDQLQTSINLYDSLIGYERDGNELVPSTAKGAQLLQENYPLHADYLAADLLNGLTRDPNSGKQMSRMDVALSALSPSAIGNDPELQARRAEALKLLGAVEPSSISPQWQPSAEELSVIREDLQETYKKLPYEDREDLKLNSPEFINRTLEREKYTQQLQSERQALESQQQEQQQQREQYVAQQAAQAGEQYLGTLLTDALTTFHNSVVEKCCFIQPIDPQTPPQGMTAEQVTQMNAQIDASNKAEAAQITAMVVALQNEDTRAFVVPLLKQMGAIDDKFLKDMDDAAKGLGMNARNFGELEFRGKLRSNGNGFQPDASMAGLNNAARHSLGRLIHFANQLAGRLMEKRSQFFSLKAQDHNQALNSTAATRPIVQGSTYDPTSAAPNAPKGWLSRQQIEQQYG